MLEWPIKRQLHQDPSTEAAPLDVFLQTFRSSTALQGGEFQALVEAVTEALRLRSDPQDTIAHLSDWPNLFASEEEESIDSGGVVLAFAFVKVLRTNPNAATWSYFWSLAWHSSILMDSLL